MKRLLQHPGLIVAILAIALLLPVVGAQGDNESKIETRVVRDPSVSIFGQDLLIGPNIDHRAPVVCVGCDVTVEGRVADNVVVVFGSLTVVGEVRDNAVGVFSKIDARRGNVGDTLVNVLGSLDSGAIDGSIINVSSPFGWTPNLFRLMFWVRAFVLLITFIVLVGLASVVPERVERIAAEAPVQYMSAFFAGLLAYLAAAVLVTVLSVTLIGLPAGALFVKIAKLLGLTGVFLFVGRRVGQMLGREMSLLGAVLLCFGIYAAILLTLSWLGAIGLVLILLFKLFFWLLFEVPALGLVVLTRFGTRTA